MTCGTARVSAFDPKIAAAVFVKTGGTVAGEKATTMGAAIEIKAPVERAPLEQQLRRYKRGFRRRVRRLTGESRQLGDLIYTFPAAALIFATGNGNAGLRGEAMELINSGADLRRVTRALGLPGWLRRLPPEAFSEPLVAGAAIPTSDRFTLRVANHIPTDPSVADMWLAWVIEAHRLAGEDFALWMAAQPVYGRRQLSAEALLPLGAYVWHSSNAGNAAAGLIRRPFQADFSFARAVEEARSFLLRIALEHCRGSDGAYGRWFVTQRISGLRFVPLRTPHELEQEGERMTNCVGSYAHAVTSGACLIYGIRRGNQHAATLEVRAVAGKAQQAFVAQLEGQANSPAPDDVQRAVNKWIKRQGRYPAAGNGQLVPELIDEPRWNSLWAPYREVCTVAHKNGRLPLGTQLLHLMMAVESLMRLAKT
ncbi:MAG: PcfJ domain-containing protein [Hyphomicrobiaceae bacterium]